MTTQASQYYIENCSADELVELAFDAQRSLASFVLDPLPDNYGDEYWAAIGYRKAIKAELVRRMGAK